MFSGRNCCVLSVGIASVLMEVTCTLLACIQTWPANTAVLQPMSLESLQPVHLWRSWVGGEISITGFAADLSKQSRNILVASPRPGGFDEFY